MEIYFIRHAQSYNNDLWDRTGAAVGRSDDPVLTEKGLAQAAALAKAITGILEENSGLNGNKSSRNGLLPRFFTSLMIRAISTGLNAAPAAGGKLEAWESIHEGGGIFVEDPETGERTGQPGKPRKYFEQNFPQLVLPRDMAEGGWWNRPHETVSECEVRARKVVDDLWRCHEEGEGQVVLFSHGGFYNMLLRVFFQVPEEANIWFGLNNCGITRIDLSEGEVQLVYANRIDFLPKDLVS